MTKKKKIFLSIVAVVLALSTYGYFFGIQTLCVVWSRSRCSPRVNLVPVNLTVGLCSEPVGKLEAFNCKFSVPWIDCEQGTFTNVVYWRCLASNINVICFAPEGGFYSQKFCKAFIGSDSKNKFSSKDKGVVDRFLGIEKIANKNSQIFGKMLDATPKDITIFDSRPEALTKMALLWIKRLIVKDISKIYSFEYGNMTGFEFGNPSVDHIIRLSFFDQRDREVRLIVSVSTNSPVPLTQADINTIITTFSSNP